MQYREELTENDVVWNCCVWLNSNGWFAWRNNSAGVFDKSRGAYRKPPPFCIDGVSDVVAMRDGDVVFIEAKSPKGGSQRSSQKLFEKQCVRHGVKYILVSSMEEMICQMK